MKSQYNKQTNTIKEIPVGYYEPTGTDHDSYVEYIASLKEYPCHNSCKWSDGQVVEEEVDYRLMDSNKWFLCTCDCGWQDSSEFSGGGGQIADTGDYDDACCPRCGNKNINIDEDDILSTGIICVPIKDAPDKISEYWDSVPIPPQPVEGKGEDEKQVLISRLKELKKYHIDPYNLGDMGEIGQIIDKL